MTELLYDSDNPDSIPDGVHAAGYQDGYAAAAWNARGWKRFPNALRITCFASTNAGDVGDVERGDMLPWELPGWVVKRRQAGVKNVWGYVSASNWNATRTEFHLRGIPEPLWWIADYDNVPVIPNGAQAKQYANQVLIPGKPHYDLSVVQDGLLGGYAMGTVGALDEKWLTEAKAIIDKFFGTGGLDVTPTATLAELVADIKAIQGGAVTLTPQQAADIATIAAALRKLGTP